ncbi:hypothetical protein [Amycolatopsis sp. cmx-11-51]|uniref:hypothetical protein n=1 Tax=unclassified Amycolatopsis TaxID=2618356 RepID=UPI0039E41A4E
MAIQTQLGINQSVDFERPHRDHDTAQRRAPRSQHIDLAIAWLGGQVAHDAAISETSQLLECPRPEDTRTGLSFEPTKKWPPPWS